MFQHCSKSSHCSQFQTKVWHKVDRCQNILFKQNITLRFSRKSAFGWIFIGIHQKKVAEPHETQHKAHLTAERSAVEHHKHLLRVAIEPRQVQTLGEAQLMEFADAFGIVRPRRSVAVRGIEPVAVSFRRRIRRIVIAIDRVPQPAGHGTPQPVAFEIRTVLVLRSALHRLFSICSVRRFVLRGRRPLFEPAPVMAAVDKRRFVALQRERLSTAYTLAGNTFVAKHSEANSATTDTMTLTIYIAGAANPRLFARFHAALT